MLAKELKEITTQVRNNDEELMKEYRHVVQLMKESAKKGKGHIWIDDLSYKLVRKLQKEGINIIMVHGSGQFRLEWMED